ncbi:Non-specific lipid-transfer protein-like protein [Thalictrum thalictroides]|uniref:Non-specific lipid-transfer protein-like protein n=1 Tax=Thalictrum thalictroides TaxID=46969 RepID=A0A7J6WIF2_THATH|nr:Non-specific lipid-transfer protein-like protein [Thalictrum thalictroides]
MVKIAVILCVLALWCVCNVNCATKSAPAPSQDCTTLILGMTDCLPFVTSGDPAKKPEGGCCAGLKSVLKSAPECICQTFKNVGQFGVTLNITKAMTLPSACNVKAPPFSQCGLSVAPAGSPAVSPKSSAASPKSPVSLAPTSTSPILSPGVTPISDGPSEVTTPSVAAGPAKSGASTMSISFAVLVGIVIASCSHI